MKLPIDQHRAEIIAKLRGHHSLVVTAPPGAGKTTRVPAALLDDGLAADGRIIVLQPRCVAVRAAARAIAMMRNAEVGREVGYSVRFERKVSRETRLELVTEGLFVRRLLADPLLDGVSVVVLDEFHERSIDADLVLAMVREVQAEVRPDLKIVVMSATLDPGPVTSFLADCPLISAEGRRHPVDIEYAPGDDRRLADRCAGAVRQVLQKSPDGTNGNGGDVLVFLPGMAEIRRTQRQLGGLEGVDVLPLHGSLPPSTQDRAIAPGRRRKVILSTNVAETSVTIEGVRHVIDSGLARSPRFDATIGLSRLVTVQISRASAEQRAGRAGRTAPGRCIRLWSEPEHRGLSAFDKPEISRAELTTALLHIWAWGGSPERFEWFQSPPKVAVEHAIEALTRIGALDRTGLTETGRQLAALPVHPRLGRVVIAGHRVGRLNESVSLAALASERDILTRDHRPGGSTGDIDLRLEALDAADREGLDNAVVRRWGLDTSATRRVLEVRRHLDKAARKQLGPALVTPAAKASLVERCRMLMAGFPDRVAIRRHPTSNRFVLVGGHGATLGDENSAFDAPLILALSLEGARRGERAEHRIGLACPLDRSLLDIEERLETRFDRDKEAVVQVLVRHHLGLVLSEETAGERADRSEVERVLARAVLADPAGALRPGKPELRWLARLRWLGNAMPELKLPRPMAAPQSDRSDEIADDTDREGWLWTLCHGHRSFADLRRVALLPLLEGCLSHVQRKALARHAPAEVNLPNGGWARLEYSADGPPVMRAKLQKFFGLQQAPRLAAGREAVVVHLLAPNGRPAHITSDLAGFWRSGYQEVRRELRGRYPKHAWPKDPNAETAPKRPGKDRQPNKKSRR